MNDAQSEITRLTAERDQALVKCDSLNEKLGAWMGRAGEAEARWNEALKVLEREKKDHRDFRNKMGGKIRRLNAQAAAAALEMRERAAEIANDHTPYKNTASLSSHVTGTAIEREIRALPIDPDAQKALNKMLAKMLLGSWR